MQRLEDRLRKEIHYFFLNPCEKFKARRRKPFKLSIQLVKVALVTFQVEHLKVFFKCFMCGVATSVGTQCLMNEIS